VAVLGLVTECKGLIEAEFSPAGYNIGFNVGVAAGQTGEGCHCLFVPAFCWGGIREMGCRSGAQKGLWGEK
jgi:diadenosine tetraphosphate (Ap4A) HIT family hydrolase